MKKAVLAVGNPLLGDDAVGQLVLKELEGIDADLVDFGWGMDLAVVKRYDRIAIVDAGFFGSEPGSFDSFNLDELNPGNIQTTHGVNIIFLLRKFRKDLPEIKFFLIQPETNRKLSDSVKKAIPQVAKRIREYLQN
jgi:hydrogenase maturation protease